MGSADDISTSLLHPVAAGDAEIEQALRDIGRDLLGPQDVNLADPRVVDRRPVGNLGGPSDRQVGSGKQLEGRKLQ
jgi:hypothetical protein